MGNVNASTTEKGTRKKEKQKAAIAIDATIIH
jgi:hypothetical protein